MAARYERFPFLRLPLELRVEVIRHIHDVQALRDLLFIPQVIKPLAPFFRLVTNTDRLICFDDVKKYIQQVPLRAVETLAENRDVIVLIELSSLGAEVELPSELRHSWTFIFMAVNKEWDYMNINARHSFPSISAIADLRPQATHLLALGTFNLILDDKDYRIELPRYLTLENLGTLSLLGPASCFTGSVAMPQIRYIGVLTHFSLLDIAHYAPRQADDTLHTALDVISQCESACLSIDTFGELAEEDKSWPFVVSGLTFNRLRGKLHWERCTALSNISINSSDDLGDHVYDTNKCIYLKIDMKETLIPSERFGTMQILENIVGPHVQKMKITCSEQFPKLKKVWLPNLHQLFLWGNLESNGILRFDNLEMDEDIFEISRLMSVVKMLHLDQMTFPILGYLLPDALQNLEFLSISDLLLTDRQNAHILGSIPKLRPQHGKIRLPNVKELRWRSNCSDEETALDITQLSNYFSYPNLKYVNYATRNEHVFLWRLAPSMKMVKELRIYKTKFGGYGYMNDHKRTISMRELHKQRGSFPKLKKLTVTHGHNEEMFTGLTFSRLKTLDILINLDAQNDLTVFKSPDMPSLESLTVTTNGNLLLMGPPSEHEFRIESFTHLKSFSIDSSVVQRVSIMGSMGLEHIKQTGQPLTSLSSSDRNMWKMKSMEYCSMKGVSCHNFTVSSDVVLRIT